MKNRTQQLKKNFRTMFFVQALLNFKVLNVIVTLFYIHRGISLSQIFYLSIVFAIVNLVFEIPSSYMADRWGRKRTILFGIAASFLGWVLLIFAHNMWMFVLSMICVALQFASFSGTDTALVYDTNKELGTHDDSLDRLSTYIAARNIAKIFTPLVAVLIAKDLTEMQYVSVIAIDIVAVCIAFILAFRITEPHHYMDVEKMESGVLRDAVQLIKTRPDMIRGIMSQTLVFIASFIIWRYHQELLVTHLGLSVVILGVAWGFHHAIIFLWDVYVTQRFKHNIESTINRMNGVFFISACVLYILLFIYPNPFIILVVFIIFSFSERFRWALFSQYFNNLSNSYNRATTISLANFVKSVLDVPLLFIAAILIDRNMTYPFFLTILLALITLLFFRISTKNYESKTS